MLHRSGAALTSPNQAHRVSYPRLAKASEGPLIADSLSDDIVADDEARPATPEAANEGSAEKKKRYSVLFREICSNFPTRNWDKRRRTFASLVALQGCATIEAHSIVMTVIEESRPKDDPISWFCFTVLERLKEHELWNRDLCYWFNKRKYGLDSIQSFLTMFED